MLGSECLLCLPPAAKLRSIYWMEVNGGWPDEVSEKKTTTKKSNSQRGPVTSYEVLYTAANKLVLTNNTFLYMACNKTCIPRICSCGFLIVFRLYVHYTVNIYIHIWILEKSEEYIYFV